MDVGLPPGARVQNSAGAKVQRYRPGFMSLRILGFREWGFGLKERAPKKKNRLGDRVVSVEMIT